jgi:hypothetical protein
MTSLHEAHVWRTPTITARSGCDTLCRHFEADRFHIAQHRRMTDKDVMGMMTVYKIDEGKPYPVGV